MSSDMTVCWSDLRFDTRVIELVILHRICQNYLSRTNTLWQIQRLFLFQYSPTCFCFCFSTNSCLDGSIKHHTWQRLLHILTQRWIQLSMAASINHSEMLCATSSSVIVIGGHHTLLPVSTSLLLHIRCFFSWY